VIKILFIQIMIFSLNLRGESQSPYTSEERFVREGRYVTVTLLMGDPIKIFVSGKEALRLSRANLKIEFRSKNERGWNELKLNSSGNYYEIESRGAPQESGPALEVKTTLKNKKSEVFNFKIPKT
jgi:hypothetical protein